MDGKSVGIRPTRDLSLQWVVQGIFTTVGVKFITITGRPTEDIQLQRFASLNEIFNYGGWLGY